MCIHSAVQKAVRIGKITTFAGDLKRFILFTVCLHRFVVDHIINSLAWSGDSKQKPMVACVCMCVSPPQHVSTHRFDMFNRKKVAPVCCCSQIQINEQHHQINKYMCGTCICHCENIRDIWYQCVV